MLVINKHAVASSLEDFGLGFSRLTTATTRIKMVHGSQISEEPMAMPPMSSESDYYSNKNDFFLGDSSNAVVKIPYELIERVKDRSSGQKRWVIKHIERFLINGNFTLYACKRVGRGRYKILDKITLPYPDYNPTVAKMNVVRYLVDGGCSFYRECVHELIVHKDINFISFNLKRTGTSLLLGKAVSPETSSNIPSTLNYSESYCDIDKQTLGLASMLTSLRISNSCAIFGYVDFPDKMMCLPLNNGIESLQQYLVEDQLRIMLGYELTRLKKLFDVSLPNFENWNDNRKINYLYYSGFKTILRASLQLRFKYNGLNLTKGLYGQYVYLICRRLGLGKMVNGVVVLDNDSIDRIQLLINPKIY